MPSLHNPLRHYPSRQKDGLRQHATHPSNGSEKVGPQNSMNLDKVLPPIGTPEFHDRPLLGSRAGLPSGNGMESSQSAFKAPPVAPEPQYPAKSMSNGTKWVAAYLLLKGFGSMFFRLT